MRSVNIGCAYTDGDTVTLLWEGSRTTTDSTTYENTDAWFRQIRDGKVVDRTAFYDSMSFHKLWAEVTPA